MRHIMKIQKVEIKGLFGKKDIEWELNPQVNVLVGENGSGKSTILSTIYCMLKGVAIANSTIILNQCTLSFDNTETPLQISSIDTNLVVSLLQEDKEEWEKIKNILSSKNNNSYDKKDDDYAEMFISFLKNNYFSKNQDKRYYISIDNKSINTINPTIISTLHLSSNANFDFKENQMEVSNILDTRMENIVYQFRLKENNTKIQERLINALNFFLNMIGKYATYKENSIRYFYQDNQQELNFSNLSSGERQLIYMLVQVALNATETDKSSIILMDEPEISLHLDWQENFINQLINLSPNTQFIIVTHSPAIIMNGWNAIYLDMQEITK